MYLILAQKPKILSVSLLNEKYNIDPAFAQKLLMQIGSMSDLKYVDFEDEDIESIRKS